MTHARALAAMLTGPIVWAVVFTARFAAVPRIGIVRALTVVGVAVTLGAAIVGWRALRAAATTQQRFFAVGGLALNGYFILLHLAAELPTFLLGTRD